MRTVSRHVVYQPVNAGLIPAWRLITLLSSPHARTGTLPPIRGPAGLHPDRLCKELRRRERNYPSLPAVVGHSRPAPRRRGYTRRPQSTLRHKGSNGVGGHRPRGRRAKPGNGLVLSRRTTISQAPADLAVTARQGRIAPVRRTSDRPRAVDPHATNDMPNGHTDGATEHRTANDDHSRARDNAADKTGDHESTVNSGEIDQELDPWLAKHAGGECTNNECPRCGERLLGKDKEVISERGKRYENIGAALSKAACYCPECWKERRAIEKKRETTVLTDFGFRIDNQQLSDFAGEQGGDGE